MLLRKIKLLCITCPREDISYEEQVTLACQGGADMIQLRDKKLPDMDLFNISVNLQKICKKYNVYFTVNNRIDIADIAKSDGVHIGQNDLPPEYARKLIGDSKIIGLSASTYEQVIAASDKPVDYIGYGAVFATITKPESQERGLDVLSAIKKQNSVKAPIIAIGGIDKTNVADVIRAGADGIAVVRAVCGAKDIKKEAEDIKNIIFKTEREGRIQ
ncbi:MAG: thiamine phosphate synthase [Endomicrobiaceae bacterium]